jgi:hypothetical protein
MNPRARAAAPRVIAALSVALSTGCASMGAMQRADTLPPGKYQVLVETSVQNAVGRDLGDGERISWPYLAVHYRRGRVGQRGQWVLGPRVQYLRTFPAAASSARPFELFAAGASFGVVVPLGRDFGVMPEVSVLSPFGRDRFVLYERLSPKMGGTDGVLLQVGLGFLFGGFPSPEAEVPAR